MVKSKLTKADAQEAPRLQLNSHLPYLMNRAGNLINQLFSRDLAELGLSVPTWRVLAVLAERGPQRLIDLAVLTSIEVSTLSRIVSGMDNRRLVTRSIAELSRREVVITVTDTGRNMVSRAVPIALDYEAELTRGVSEADLEITRRTLRIAFDRLLDCSGRLKPEKPGKP